MRGGPTKQPTKVLSLGKVLQKLSKDYLRNRQETQGLQKSGKGRFNV